MFLGSWTSGCIYRAGVKINAERTGAPGLFPQCGSFLTSAHGAAQLIKEFKFTLMETTREDTRVSI